MANKIAILNAKLAEYGFSPIPTYNVAEAEAARKKNLQGLDPASYKKTILSTGS